MHPVNTLQTQVSLRDLGNVFVYHNLNAYQALGDQDNAQRVLKETLERSRLPVCPYQLCPRLSAAG